MPWNDISNWDDTTIWSDSDTLDVVTATATDVPKVQKDREKYITPYTPPPQVVVLATYSVTGDSELTDIVPPGYLIDKIIFVEGNSSTGQLSAGTSEGAFDIFQSEAITAGAATVVNVSKYYPDGASIFIHNDGDGDTWGAMILSVFVVLINIFNNG